MAKEAEIPLPKAKVEGSIHRGWRRLWAFEQIPQIRG